MKLCNQTHTSHSLDYVCETSPPGLPHDVMQWFYLEFVCFLAQTASLIHQYKRENITLWGSVTPRVLERCYHHVSSGSQPEAWFCLDWHGILSVSFLSRGAKILFVGLSENVWSIFCFLAGKTDRSGKKVQQKSFTALHGQAVPLLEIF